MSQIAFPTPEPGILARRAEICAALGALLPVRVENLLPACKNIGTTHITNGCYRMHPVEWNTGESAGLLAARAIQLKTPPRRIRNSRICGCRDAVSEGRHSRSSVSFWCGLHRPSRTS